VLLTVPLATTVRIEFSTKCVNSVVIFAVLNVACLIKNNVTVLEYWI